MPPPRGIPVLDENIKSTEAVNFNHPFYIALSRRMAKEALDFIQSHPRLYLASVKQGFSIYFHSSIDYLLLKDKLAPRLESLWDILFYGQRKDYGGDYTNRWRDDPAYVGWWLVVAYLVAVIYGLKIFLSRGRTSRELAGVVGYMTFTTLYFTVMANFLDLGENNRSNPSSG